MMKKNLPKGMGIISYKEFIKHLENSCPRMHDCDRLNQLMMNDKPLIEFRKNVCYTKRYKNCEEELSKLFGWGDEKNKYLPKWMGIKVI